MATPAPKPGNRKKKSAKPDAVAAEKNEAFNVPVEEIASLAFSYWEGRACQGGSAEEDWLRAEQELRFRLRGR